MAPDINILLVPFDHLPQVVAQPTDVPATPPATPAVAEAPAALPPALNEDGAVIIPADPAPAPPHVTLPALPAAPPRPASPAAPQAPAAPAAPEVPVPGRPAIVPLLSARAPQRPLPLLAARGSRVETRVAAKRRELDPGLDNLFKAEPDTDGLARPKTNSTEGTSPAAQPMNSVVAAPTNSDMTPLSDFVPVPGMAQNAAAPLRRALVRAGFDDVLATPPDGVAVRRVVNERRVSEHVLSMLGEGMSRLVNSMAAATPPAAAQPAATTPAATAPAAISHLSAGGDGDPELPKTVQAAARLGQAMGYRCVVLLAVAPTARAAASGGAAIAPANAGAVNSAPGAVAAATVLDAPVPLRSAAYTLLMVDAFRGTSEVLSLDGDGSDWLAAHQSAASSEAAWLLKRLMLWSKVTPEQKAQLAAAYVQGARKLAATAPQDALDMVSQALALDGGRPETYALQGDLLAATDPSAAAIAYRRALDSPELAPGLIWEKIAAAYASAKDWPHTLEAASHALALHRDTAPLRLAMATAQFGRAELFRQADRSESAEAAATAGHQYLERARTLDPDSPQVVRLQADQLIAAKRIPEALGLLDNLVPRVAPEPGLQEVYATALADGDGREVDAFLAYANLWKMTGTHNAPLTGARYRRLTEGFDLFVTDLARQAAQQAAGVAGGTVPREAAVLQLQHLAARMQEAEDSIQIMRPPPPGSGPAGNDYEAIHAARIFAADLIHQAITAYGVYAETGDEVRRNRGYEMHRQAINQLNAARLGPPTERDDEGDGADGDDAG